MELNEKLFRMIGKGKFAEVFELEDSDKELAVKVLDPEKWGQGENTALKDLQLADREVQSWEIINGNPYFPEFHGSCREEGRQYILLERIKGSTLRESLQERMKLSQGSFSAGESRKIILDTARGLKAIHNLGYLHRDISSSNIMLTEEDKVKLVDIGAMKELDEINQLSSTCLHTPGYAAPEVMIGEYSKQSDLYALGALWAELISGQEPKELVSREMGTPYRIHYRMDDREDDRLLQQLVSLVPEERPGSVDAVIEYIESKISGKKSDGKSGRTTLPQISQKAMVKMTDWDIPEVEITQFVQEDILGKGLRDPEKIRRM